MSSDEFTFSSENLLVLTDCFLIDSNEWEKSKKV